MKKLSNEDVVKSLGLIANEYKKVISGDKKEGKAIYWGIRVIKQAQRIIKQAIQTDKNISKYLKDLCEEMKEDSLTWWLESVVEIEEVVLSNEPHAKISGDKYYYKKQDDEYIIQWEQCEDCYSGFILKPIQGNTYLKIGYNC